jgi:hypothetical protein
LVSQSPDDTVAAQEQARPADNRLSTHIARARELAERADAERARSDIRWRLGETWVTLEDPWAEPKSTPSRLEVSAPAHLNGQAPGGEPTVEKG